MRFLLIAIVVMVGLQSANSLNITMSELKDIAMKMKNATQYVSEANAALKAEDVGKFINAIGNLVSLIPGPVGIIGGGVLGLTAAFFPGAKVPTELSIVLGELNKVSDKLHDLSNTVEEAKGEMTAEIRKTILASYEKYMDEIDGDYKAVLQRSSEPRKSQMISTCNKNGYHTIARWFKDELDGKHTTSSIVSQVRAQNDRRAYFDFAKVLIGNFVRATVLQTACTSVIYSSKPPQELDAVLAEDAKEYQELLEAMKNKLQEEDDKIVATFWETAKSDIEKMAAGKNTMDHGTIANIFHQFLLKKFYWRQWFVAVYGSQDTAGFGTHSFEWHNNGYGNDLVKYGDYESYFKNFIRLHNRNIVIASPPEDVPASFVQKADNCISNAPTKTVLIDDCKEALQIVKKCMEGTSYMAIGCAKEQKPFAVAQNAKGAVHRHIRSSHTGGFYASITVTYYYDMFLTY